jgi:hypothetical protein
MMRLKTLAWIIRHPIFAASWYLTGQPFSHWYGGR